MPTHEISRRPERQRYELLVDGAHAGHVTWFMKGGVTVLDHTTIGDAYGGQGLASVLARGALDDIKGRGVPYAIDCEFLRSWVGKHPEYADVPLWVWPSDESDDQAG